METEQFSAIDVKEEPVDVGYETIKQKAPNRKVLQCNECDYTTVHRSQFMSHMVKHTGNYPFKCELCGSKFTAKASMQRHIEAVHEGIRLYTCVFCPKSFFNAAGLKSHSVVHTKLKAHQCKICEKSFSLRCNLHRHMRIHSGEKRYKCTTCDASFTDYSSLRYHMLRHTGEKPYLCHVCHKQFVTASDLKRHSSIHTGEKPHECSECGQFFAQKETLKVHMRKHAKDRPTWECRQCGKKLFSKSSREVHELTHTNAKPYECSICHKRFTSKMYLKNHNVVHTGEKPFKCETCGKEYNQIPNLKRHQRTHSSKLWYNCRYCGKGFRYRNSIAYHEQAVHTNEKRFFCEVCRTGFKSCNGMKGHRCSGEKREPSDEDSQKSVNDKSAFSNEVKRTIVNRGRRSTVAASSTPSTECKVLISKKKTGLRLVFKVSNPKKSQPVRKVRKTKLKNQRSLDDPATGAGNAQSCSETAEAEHCKNKTLRKARKNAKQVHARKQNINLPDVIATNGQTKRNVNSVITDTDCLNGPTTFDQQISTKSTVKKKNKYPCTRKRRRKSKTPSCSIAEVNSESIKSELEDTTDLIEIKMERISPTCFSGEDINGALDMIPSSSALLSGLVATTETSDATENTDAILKASYDGKLNGSSDIWLEECTLDDMAIPSTQNADGATNNVYIEVQDVGCDETAKKQPFCTIQDVCSLKNIS